MIRRPPRSTPLYSSAASDVYKRQLSDSWASCEEVRGGVEPWLMARWKARVEFLLSLIGLLFLSLTVEALQGKMCQNSLPSGVGRSLGANISGGRGLPWGIFFGFYKTRHILLSDRANCTVLRAVVLTQYRRVTDRQTDRQTELLWLVQRLQCEHCACNASIAASCKNFILQPI